MTDLSKYKCLKCGSTPKLATEIFQKGCFNCGNRYFKLIRDDNTLKSNNLRRNLDLSADEKMEDDSDDFTITFSDRGIYKINLDALLDKKKPITVGGNGIYKIAMRDKD